jgi:hypothetical protein
LNLFFGGIVSCFSAETRWAPMLGVQKIGWNPRTQESRTSARKLQPGDKESPKACTHLKSCEALYTCPRAPFYKDTKGLLHSEIPSNLRNIPSVNMDMNVFYIPWFAGLISYIYQATTSSHVQPRLLRQRLWLGFFLISVSLIREDPHTP